MIPITTTKGEFKVWTKRVGINPKIKFLLLNTQTYFTRFLKFLFEAFPTLYLKFSQ